MDQFRLPAELLDGQGLPTDTVSEPTVFIREDDELHVDSRSNSVPLSFGDADVRIILPWFRSRRHGGVDTSHVIRLHGLNLLSISEHRDVFPVVKAGGSGIRGFTKGHRTTAGSIAFTSFGPNPFKGALMKFLQWSDAPYASISRIAPDELPPFDIHVVMVNGQGNVYAVYIKAVNIVDSSRAFGVQDPQISEMYSYIAASATITHSILQVTSDIGSYYPPKGHTGHMNF